MRKWRILPKLALTGVIKNGAVYFPYFGAGIFSVFTFFIFSSILHNDIIQTLPNSSYAWMLLQTGRVLLGIILLPFIYYANSFLIKRRKKEIGLYSILGLEKKHIGSMMLIETLFTYAVALVGGVIGGVILSKLLFLLLLRMSGLPVNIEFVFVPAAFMETMVYFGIVYFVNFLSNLVEMGKSKPVELLAGSKKGEKEPKFLWLYAVLGLLLLAGGYVTAIRSQVDSMIFINFFLAVLLVVLGTYFLFTSGSVAFLKLMKKRRKTYYHSSNFVTISGMLYRMKKNAASLVNICIFSTMVIITLLCTASLYGGLEDIKAFDYPYDIDVTFRGEKIDEETIYEELAVLQEEHNVPAEKIAIYDQIGGKYGKEENVFKEQFTTERMQENFDVYFLTLEDYNRMENRSEALENNEVIYIGTGPDYGYDTLRIMGKEFSVKEELKEMSIAPKADENKFGESFYIVVKDKTVRDECVRDWAEANGVEDINGYIDSGIQNVRIKINGEEADRNAFIADYRAWCEEQPGFELFTNGYEGSSRIMAMNGGLLFIGILFSMVFMMCLILIMYYKQITEGYEDKESFAIMQKVGMSDKEIKNTVQRQIILVFFLPLFGAVMHTAAGFTMINRLFATVRLFNTQLVIICALAVTAVFVLLYGISYIITAKTYYGIVKQRG